MIFLTKTTKGNGNIDIKVHTGRTDNKNLCEIDKPVTTRRVQWVKAELRTTSSKGQGSNVTKSEQGQGVRYDSKCQAGSKE